MRLFVCHQRELPAWAWTSLPTWETVEGTLEVANVDMCKKREQLDDHVAFLTGSLTRGQTLLHFEALKMQRRVAHDSRMLSE